MQARFAPAASAIFTVSALDAATAQGVAMPIRAILVGAALDASAAVGSAQAAERRCRALAILVTVVANAAPLVAAVGRRWTVHLLATDGQTAVGELVTSEPRPAV